MAENVSVRSHKRQLRSGKVVTVKAHSTSRDLVADSLSESTNRPPTASQPGRYANSRSTPDSPQIAKARMRIVDAKIRTAQRELEEALPEDERENPEVDALLDEIVADGTPVEQAVDSLAKEMMRVLKDSFEDDSVRAAIQKAAS